MGEFIAGLLASFVPGKGGLADLLVIVLVVLAVVGVLILVSEFA
jgi:hypothetical protein